MRSLSQMRCLHLVMEGQRNSIQYVHFFILVLEAYVTRVEHNISREHTMKMSYWRPNEIHL